MNVDEILILCFIIISGPVGVVLNAAFITVTISKSELRKEYTWFLCGMAGANLLYCLNNAINQIIALVLGIGGESIFCQIVAVILGTNGLTAVCVQALLALNRFVALIYPQLKAKLFSNKKNAIMLISFYIFSLVLMIGLVFMNDMGRMVGTICGPKIEQMPLSHLCVFFIPMSLSYFICIFCGYKIFKFLKTHQQTAQRQEMRSQIQHAKEISRLIVIEIVVPLSLESPALFLSLLTTVLYIPNLVLTISICLFIIHPVFDPLVVVFVMKPYRNFVKRIWRKCRGVTDVEPMSTRIAETKM